MLDTIVVCGSCGEPASYHIDYELVSDDLCERCACERGAMENGTADAMLDAMRFAIEALREARISDEKIRLAVEAILADPQGEISFYELLGSRLHRNRQWARTFTPIREEGMA
jgi:predicted amidophosphoribosyltransferase